MKLFFLWSLKKKITYSGDNGAILPRPCAERVSVLEVPDILKNIYGDKLLKAVVIDKKVIAYCGSSPDGKKRGRAASESCSVFFAKAKQENVARIILLDARRASEGEEEKIASKQGITVFTEIKRGEKITPVAVADLADFLGWSKNIAGAVLVGNNYWSKIIEKAKSGETMGELYAYLSKYAPDILWVLVGAFEEAFECPFDLNSHENIRFALTMEMLSELVDSFSQGFGLEGEISMIHCGAGHGRTARLIAALKIKLDHFTSKEAIDFIECHYSAEAAKELRSQHDGQLKVFEDQCRSLNCAQVAVQCHEKSAMKKFYLSFT